MVVQDLTVKKETESLSRRRNEWLLLTLGQTMRRCLRKSANVLMYSLALANLNQETFCPTHLDVVFFYSRHIKNSKLEEK